MLSYFLVVHQVQCVWLRSQTLDSTSLLLHYSTYALHSFEVTLKKKHHMSKENNCTESKYLQPVLNQSTKINIFTIKLLSRE